MYWEKTSTPTSGWSWRIDWAARRPSSVWVGGMRTSMMATSGRSSSTACRSATASATAATTSWPRRTRVWVSPSRMIAESSAITMRNGAGITGAGITRGPAIRS